MIEENKARLLANRSLLQNVIDELPYYIETMKFQTKTAKIKFDAFIKECFTPEQSLFLCKDK